MGRTEIGPGQVSASVARCSAISCGPVAQLRPMIGTSSAATIAAAAAMSVPTSRVPVVSTVTWTISGSDTPASRIACRAPLTAALACSGSWQVSHKITSAPPAIRPAAWTANACSSVPYAMWPSEGRRVPGPIAPITKRLRPSPATFAIASRASSAARRLISNARSPRSNSPSVTGEPPKLLVSSASAPASR